MLRGYFIFWLTSVIFIVNTKVGSTSKPCQVKEFDDGMVCVCGMTYCDTVEPNTRLKHGKYAVYSTTKAGQRLTKSLHDFHKSGHNAGVSLLIERSTRYQTILGFGGAFTDSAGVNIASLSKPAADNLLRSYFSPDGLEYTIGRIPMASCDFSTHIYSYDDHVGDLELNKFSLTQEDFKYKIPYIHQAKAMNKREMKLFGSPWSAPGWMKTTGKMPGNGTLLGQAGDKYHTAWAKYFVRFLEEYQKQNLSLWGITAQNEPLTGYFPNYPFQAMGFTAESQRDFIARDLGPMLHKHGFQDVKLMILDDQRLQLPQWPKIVMGDPEAAKYVSGVAVHWYWDFVVPAYPLSLTHEALPQLFILYTEACEGYKKWTKEKAVILGSWERLETYVKDIMDDLANWVSGWTDWNLALDMEGGPNWVKNYVDSPIIVNKDKDEFYKQPMFYALGHFSKFLPPDSYRIGLVGGNIDSGSELQTLAFSTPDNSTVVIVSNPSSSEQTYQIMDPDRGTIDGTSPAKSILTYIWW